MKKNFIIFIFIFSIFLLIGCNKKADNESDIETEKEQYKLMFVNEEYTVYVGEQIKLEIDTNVLDVDEIIYEIGDETIISLLNNGNYKGKKVGETIVNAKYEDIIATTKIIVVEKPKTYTKNDYQYWTNLIGKTVSTSDVLMNDMEIKKYNEAVYSDYSKTKVYDLSKLSLNITAGDLKEKINTYTNINKYNVYTEKGSILSSSDKNDILNNRNIDSITSDITASYGVIISFARMRSYPTNCYSNDKSYDRFMETGLDVGETVIIYHYSKDENWCFVQAENYFGWIEATNVAKCTKEDFIKYYQNEKYMVIISERYTIEGVILRMGDKLPYKELMDNGFIVYFPKKNNDGSLNIEEILISNDEKVNDGYLAYSYDNLLCQAFKLLNTPYRWGDLNVDGRDCSSTMNAIYHCFGFVMPRNTSNQNSVPGYSSKVNGLDNEEMKNYNVGTLIFTSTHVMMYIGQDENGTCYLLHNSGYCKLQTLQNYLTSVNKEMIATLTIR